MTPRPSPALPGAGGVVPVDKPTGPTSHDVVATVRRALGERRIGHTGTLDPFASGLLLLCVGSATRLSEYLTALDKEYLATLRLGQRTSTDDTEGEVEAENEGWRALDRDELERALGAFRGRIHQRPPSFSAKKVGGEAAHRRARRGEALVLEPVEVTVHELEMEALELPFARLRVRCSSGTYVRALARDLGESLGVGAHLTALRRTRVGRFSVEDAVPPHALEDRLALSKACIEPAEALAHLPSVVVSAHDARSLTHGQAIDLAGGGVPEDGVAVALCDGALVAVVVREGERLRPRKVFQAAG